MSKLLVFREGALGELVSGVGTNLTRYKENTPWIEEMFIGKVWNAASKLDDIPDDLLQLPDGTSDYDLENSRRLYEALHGLTLTQAADPRLWVYLTHVKFWSYMRKRWPADRYIDSGQLEKARGTIVDRYFLAGDRSRGVTRNGVARLWWVGYTCYTESDDPSRNMELAVPLFAKQDIFASFMERAFSKNRELMHAVLRPLQRRHAAGRPFDVRDDVRGLAKYLILTGGVTILDGIDPLRIESIVESYIEQCDRKTQN